MDAQQTNTVSCRSCKEPIIVGAAKCRYCHAFQNWRGNPNLWAPILAASVVCIALSAMFWTETLSKLEELKTSLHRISYSNQVDLAVNSWTSAPNTTRPGCFSVAVLTTATNGSSSKWYRPSYQIQVFDAKNQLVDAASERDDDLIFFPKSACRARVVFTTVVDPKTIAKIEVKILNAYEKN